MQLKNAALIALVQQYGEDTILLKLQQKLDNDAYRKNYMKERNAEAQAVRKTPEYKALLRKLQAK